MDECSFPVHRLFRYTFFFSLSVWVTYTDDYDPKIERVNREVFLMIVI